MFFSSEITEIWTPAPDAPPEAIREGTPACQQLEHHASALAWGALMLNLCGIIITGLLALRDGLLAPLLVVVNGWMALAILGSYQSFPQSPAYLPRTQNWLRAYQCIPLLQPVLCFLALYGYLWEGLYSGATFYLALGFILLFTEIVYRLGASVRSQETRLPANTIPHREHSST